MSEAAHEGKTPRGGRQPGFGFGTVPPRGGSSDRVGRFGSPADIVGGFGRGGSDTVGGFRNKQNSRQRSSSTKSRHGTARHDSSSPGVSDSGIDSIEDDTGISLGSDISAHAELDRSSQSSSFRRRGGGGGGGSGFGIGSDGGSGIGFDSHDSGIQLDNGSGIDGLESDLVTPPTGDGEGIEHDNSITSLEGDSGISNGISMEDCGTSEETAGMGITNMDSSNDDEKRPNRTIEIPTIKGIITFQHDSNSTGPADVPEANSERAHREKVTKALKECTQLTDFLFVGGQMVAQNLELLHISGITHIINCAADVCDNEYPQEFEYLTLHLLDGGSEDLTSFLYDTVHYIDTVREQGGKIMVHCQQGVSRSPALCIGYLMYHLDKEYEEVARFVRARRSISAPNVHFTVQLIEWRTRLKMGEQVYSSLYRIAPHSIRDNKLVCKWVEPVSSEVLDSRGLFIFHSRKLDSAFLWVGKDCKNVREMTASAMRFIENLQRYENAPEKVVTILDGAVPRNKGEQMFWAELSGGSSAVVVGQKVEKFDKDYDEAIRSQLKHRKGKTRPSLHPALVSADDKSAVTSLHLQPRAYLYPYFGEIHRRDPSKLSSSQVIVTVMQLRGHQRTDKPKAKASLSVEKGNKDSSPQYGLHVWIGKDFHEVKHSDEEALRAFALKAAENLGRQLGILLGGCPVEIQLQGQETQAFVDLLASLARHTC